MSDLRIRVTRDGAKLDLPDDGAMVYDRLHAEIDRVIRSGGCVTVDARRATDEPIDRAQIAALGDRRNYSAVVSCDIS